MALMQSDLTRTRFITPVLWLLISMPVINAWPVVRQRLNDLRIDRANLTGKLTGWTGLMAGIIAQAQLDASFGDPDSMGWLAGDVCGDMCFVIGFNHKIIIDWTIRIKKEWQRMDDKILEIKKRVVDRMNLPGICVDMLRGENQKEISEDAARLIKFIYPAPAMDQLKNIRATENIK